MCIIGVCNESIPNLEQVQSCVSLNPHGVGLAWITRSGLVRWIKGLSSAREVYRILVDQGPPIVFHARTASVGGVSNELCHPFPIEPGVPLTRTGTTGNGVLFHNGYWEGWQTTCSILSAVNGWPKLEDQVSDTRYMAWLAVYGGQEVLELLGEKVVVMTPSGITVFGQGWTEDKGILWSNEGYKTSMRLGRFYRWPTKWLDGDD